MSVYFAEAYPGQSNPLAVYWGVDSLRRASEGPPQGSSFIGGYTTLYDAVVSSNGAGKRPDFWGRYIGPIGNTQLTQPEVSFLNARNVKILLIYNNTYAYRDPQDPSNYDHISTYTDGVFHANAAIDYVTTQGFRIPPRASGRRVWIYLNTETGTDTNIIPNRPYPTLPSEFFRGWCDRLSDSTVPYGLVGGVYGSTAIADASIFSQPFCNAWAQDPLMRAEVTLSLLYSPRPMRCFGPSCVTSVLAAHPGPFSPTSPPCTPPIPPVVIYQYAGKLTIAGVSDQVDFDLANGVGYESMWAPAKWKWRKIKHESAFGDFPVHPVEYNDSDHIFVAWHATTLNRKVAAKSTDSGQTWTNYEQTELNADRRGSIVRRGAAIDYYANLPEAGTAVLYIKRYTFDGATWQASVTLLQKTGATDAAIRRPYAFRDPVDNSRRALVWQENERRDEVGSGGGPVSASETYPWVDEGLYGKCGWCDDPNPPPGESECGSAAAGRGQYCHTALYERWGLSAPNSGTLQDISGLGGLSLPSYVSIRGIEVTATMSRSGFGGPHPGYERPDLTNAARFRDLNCTGSFGAPAGTQDDCTAPHTNVTTSGGASIRLKKPDGSLGSSKPIGDGTVVCGSATDKWGLGWSPSDLASFGAQVAFSFGFTDEVVINDAAHPVIRLQGAGAPSPVPAGSISVSVNNVRVYYEAYGTLWYADLDASGNLVGVTKLKDGLPVSDSYNGYFNAGGDHVVSWLEPNLDALVHKRTRVGGVWGAESTHAASATDWGDQIVPLGSITQAGVFSASLKEDLSRFHGMRYDGSSFAFTRRDTPGGVANDEAINDLRATAVATPAPGPEAVHMVGHGMAQRQKDAVLKMALATDDNAAFDVWYITRDW